MAKLLYFISEDWFFCSHFLERAKEAQRAGYEVTVLTRVGRHGESLRAAGFQLIALQMDRSSTNPLRELGVLHQVWRAYRAVRPDLVHQIAFKPILYGTLVARMLGLKNVVNAPVGMGYVFTSRGMRGSLLRGLVRLALRALLNPRDSKVVFENEEDLAHCVASGSARVADAQLIPGAGVDTDAFQPGPPDDGPAIVVLGARMMRDKGVGEFVEAAQLLRARGVAVRCVLVGASDPANPSSIDAAQLAAWHAEGAVEYWGHQQDMASVLRRCHIACLPSYREGLPKFLIEAMACGLPMVSTDVPGCRQLVVPHETGLLVPAQDAQALALAIETLACDAQLRKRMGARARELALRRYANGHIVQQTLQLYAMLRKPSPAA